MRMAAWGKLITECFTMVKDEDKVEVIQIFNKAGLNGTEKYYWESQGYIVVQESYDYICLAKPLN